MSFEDEFESELKRVNFPKRAVHFVVTEAHRNEFAGDDARLVARAYALAAPRFAGSVFHDYTVKLVNSALNCYANNDTWRLPGPLGQD